MSDNVVQKSDCNEGQILLSNKTDGRESSYQSRWLSHWRQPGTSSSSHAFKHHVISGIDDRAQKKEQGHFLVESMKSKEVNMDIKTKNSFECTTMPRYDPKELGLTSDVLQSTQILGAENEENITKSSMVLKNVRHLDSKALLSRNGDKNLLEYPENSKALLSRNGNKNLLEFPENGKSFPGYHSIDSENARHFPMLDINRKIQSILAPKEKPEYDAMSARMTELHLPLGLSRPTPHVMEFASEEHRFEARSISQSTELEIRPHKSNKGFLSYGDDHSHLAVHRFECNRSNRTSCLCTREEIDPYLYKEQFASTNLTHMNHELCNCCNRFRSMGSKTKNDCGMIGNSFGSTWLGLKDGSMQALRDFHQADALQSFIARKHGKQMRYTSCHELLPIHEATHESSKVANSGCICKMPICSLHNVNALGACSTLNFLDTTKVEPQRFSNETQYLLITQKMGMDMPPGDQTIRKSMLSSGVKKTAFLEMPKLDSMFTCHFHQVENTHSPLALTTGEEDGRVSNDIWFRHAPDKYSDKTNTIHNDIPLREASPAGQISSNSKKDVVSHTLTKSDSKTSSLLHQSFFKNATCSGVRELSTSRTESMGINHSLSYFEKPIDSSNPVQEIPSSLEQIPGWCKTGNNSNHLQESKYHPAESSRWVKRLRHNPFDSLSLATKRFKTGDGSYRRQVRDSPSKMLDCSDSSSDSPERLEEQQEVDNTSSPIKTRESSFGESKAMSSWISRWCRGIQLEASHRKLETAAVLCEPENLRVIQGSYEAKQFPSFTAMAMMGKATRNFRPRQFQRRGSLMVWKA